ncbi:MAG: 4Fe-4S binding protein [Anaerolineae bacterium]|nr:4Fe-4S binding protein [Anaerolineae bacterium]
MFGKGVLKGLGVTMKHWLYTYVDDIRKIPSRYAGGRDILKQMPDEEGIFTIQYPEEKRVIPERYRFTPMLLYDAATGKDLCTACGICTKVCPTQCIWIVRDKDEKGKPISRPAEFYIDASLCMNCGLCSEFCPFGAIKPNHDFERAVYDRHQDMIYDKQALLVPLEYHAAIHPTEYAEEEAAKAAKAQAKARRAQSRRRRGSAADRKPGEDGAD